MALDIGGKSIATDEEGYLENLNDWTPEVATAMALADETPVALNDEH